MIARFNSEKKKHYLHRTRIIFRISNNYVYFPIQHWSVVTGVLISP